MDNRLTSPAAVATALRPLAPTLRGLWLGGNPLADTVCTAPWEGQRDKQTEKESPHCVLFLPLLCLCDATPHVPLHCSPTSSCPRASWLRQVPFEKLASTFVAELPNLRLLNRRLLPAACDDPWAFLYLAALPGPRLRFRPRLCASACWVTHTHGALTHVSH